MKTSIRVSLSAILILPLLLVGTVFAEQSADTHTSSGDNTANETKQVQLSDSQKQEMSKRVQKRKSESKQRFSALQQKRIQTKCKNAQVPVRAAVGRLQTIQTNRTKAHANIVEKLRKLETKLENKGIDTTQLSTQITELEAKVATFNTDLAAYKQIVEDVGNMEDCSTDPVAFGTSLEDARSALQKVHDDAQAIRSYVKETIKPTLKTIKTQLHASADTHSNQDTEGTNGTN